MKTISIVFTMLLLTTCAFAQIGVGTTTPNSTLDVRGSLSTRYRTVTASTSFGITDYAIVFTGTTAIAITLPDATVCQGRIYSVKNASATIPAPVVTVNTTSSQTIDGNATWVLDETNEISTFVSNGTGWQVATQLVPVAKTGTAGGTWNQGGNRVNAIKSLGTISNFDLPFIVNNTEYMRLSATGNLGIGTSTFNATYPEKLLVDAGITTSFNVINGKGSINSYLQLNIQNRSAGSSASSDVVATADNGDENGNYVDMGINSSTYNNAAFTITSANDAYLYSAANDFAIGNATANKDIKFFTAGTLAANERMRLKANGYLGVGITAPLGKLHVYEATGASPTGITGSLYLEHGNNAGVSSIVFKSAVNSANDYGYISYSEDGSGNGSTNENGLLTIGVESGTAGSAGEDDICIKSSGRLGIKTITPGSVVDMQGISTSGIGLFVGNRAPYGQAMLEIDPGNADGTYFWCGRNAAELFSVSSTAGIRGFAAYTNFSDRRLKKNIKPLPYGLKEILQLKPVTYNWINEALSKRTEIGLLAQEVKEIIPEIVFGDELKENLTIAYSSLIPVLINAIKEQQVQIDIVKADNKLLKEGYKNLKAEMNTSSDKKLKNTIGKQ